MIKNIVILLFMTTIVGMMETNNENKRRVTKKVIYLCKQGKRVCSTDALRKINKRLWNDHRRMGTNSKGEIR